MGGSKHKQKKKKKSKKKYESESEETSSVDDTTSEEEPEKPKKPAVMPVAEKRIMPGALIKPPEQPPWFKQVLIEEERPDIVAKFGKNLDVDEAELLDVFLRGGEELVPGDLVITDDNLDEDSREYSRYEVLTKYNEGRYSAIYIVAKQTCTDNEEVLDKSLYAMKVGLRKESANTKLRFKRELAVLRELRGAGVLHTPYLFDSGRVCDRYYIVMTLFDKNLEKLKENIKGTFRPSTVYYLAGEALAAIEELHAIGYIHRDIKPTNFCIGISVTAARLFLVDFGETVKNGKNIRYGIPDAYSLPYWAIDSHKKTAASTRVDLEAWLYTFAELLYPNMLTWKKFRAESEVLAAKMKFWEELPNFVSDWSPQMSEAAKIIKDTTEKANYETLKRLMEEAKTASLQGAPLTLEWVKEMPKAFPKRADPLGSSVRSVRSKRKPPPKKKAESPKNVQVPEEYKSMTSNLMAKILSRKRKLSLPRLSWSTTVPQKDVYPQEQFLDVSGLPKAAQPTETKTEKLDTSSAQETKKKDASKESAQKRGGSAEVQPKQPPSAEKVQVTGGTGAKDESAPKPKTETDSKPEPAKSNLFQLLSLRVKRKKSSTTEAKKADSKTAEQPTATETPEEAKRKSSESAGEPSKATPSAARKSAESLFQTISKRIRRKKRDTSAATDKPVESESTAAKINKPETEAAPPAGTTKVQDTANTTAAAEPTAQTTPSPAPPKSEESLFQTISRRIRRKKRDSFAAIDKPAESASTASTTKPEKEVAPVADAAKALETSKPITSAAVTAEVAATEKPAASDAEKQAQQEAEKKPRSLISRMLPSLTGKAPTSSTSDAQKISADEGSQPSPTGKFSPSERMRMLLQRLRRKKDSRSDSEARSQAGPSLSGARKSESERSASSAQSDRSLLRRFLSRKSKQQGDIPEKETAASSEVKAVAERQSLSATTAEGSSTEGKTVVGSDVSQSKSPSKMAELRERVKRKAKGFWKKYLTKDSAAEQPQLDNSGTQDQIKETLTADGNEKKGEGDTRKEEEKEKK